MKPLYIPSGRAKEYGDYAINIYTGCPHRCYYCFAPSVKHVDRETFHSHVEPRPGLLTALCGQLRDNNITGKLIHLCFTCDPYPIGYDNRTTREVIKILKEAGNHVQILTKGDGSRDFDLLDDQDLYGVTYAGYGTGLGLFTNPASEPGAHAPIERLASLQRAHKIGIKTWVSCEPVLNADSVITLIRLANYIDKFKIGKLNYQPSDINWHDFGHEVEAVCQVYGRDYYIKDDLRAAMNTDGHHH